MSRGPGTTYRAERTVAFNIVEKNVGGPLYQTCTAPNFVAISICVAPRATQVPVDKATGAPVGCALADENDEVVFDSVAPGSVLHGSVAAGDALLLIVEAANEPARALYRGLGFEEAWCEDTPATRAVFSDGPGTFIETASVTVPKVIMRKAL